MRRSSTESVTGPLMSRLGMAYFSSPMAVRIEPADALEDFLLLRFIRLNSHAQFHDRAKR